MTYIIVAIGLWMLIGAFSFLYWWTREYDFKTSELGLLMVMSIAGIFAWFIGREVHGGGAYTIFKRRRDNK